MAQKKNILVITPQAFHQKVGHAGGKTANYYLKCFAADGFNIKIAYLGDNNKDYKLMTEDYGQQNVISVFKKSPFEKGIDYTRFKFLYPLYQFFISKYYITNNFIKDKLKKCLKEVSNSGFKPDIIIAEFTVTIYWIDIIKAEFKNSFTVASCHDVTFLSLKRYLDHKRRWLPWARHYYLSFKNHEVNTLNKFNLVAPHNFKDKELLESEINFTNKAIHVIAPYYDQYKIDAFAPKDSIIFFGAMYRRDNIDAVDFFLNNVWLKLDEYFIGQIKFIIVGGGLALNDAGRFEKFKNVEIAGFVKNPEAVFSRAIGFVVPLQLGAGIKVKVLEAMASGIAVITNQVGIEGIPAIQGVEYIHAETPDEFYENIIRLKEDPMLQKRLIENAKQMIATNFNLYASYKNYKNRITGGLDEVYTKGL